MTAREILRSCADTLESFQVVTGRPDPRAAALRVIASRLEGEMAMVARYTADEQGAVESVLARLDADIPASPAPPIPGTSETTKGRP